jgi:large subunit ribosomal protein L21
MTAMYAVVKTGGKQYRVAKDDTLIIDHVDAEAGDSIVLDQVLMMVDGDKVNVGAPTVAGAAVGATVLKQTRGPKIMVFRRKRRKNFRRVRGHRQDLTLIKIDDIAADGKLKSPAKAKAEAKPKAEKTKNPETNPVAEAAPKKAAKKAAAKTAAQKATPKKAGAKKATKAAATKKAAAKKSN